MAWFSLVQEPATFRPDERALGDPTIRVEITFD